MYATFALCPLLFPPASPLPGPPFKFQISNLKSLPLCALYALRVLYVKTKSKKYPLTNPPPSPIFHPASLKWSRQVPTSPQARSIKPERPRPQARPLTTRSTYASFALCPLLFALCPLRFAIFNLHPASPLPRPPFSNFKSQISKSLPPLCPLCPLCSQCPLC